MSAKKVGRPIEILLVEDNPGDVRLTKEALKEAKMANHLSVVVDGEQRWHSCGEKASSLTRRVRTSSSWTLTSQR